MVITRNLKKKRGGMWGMFGSINMNKTLRENQRDYERIWKNRINPETNKNYEPDDTWYWPGWTSALMGETPHPNQIIRPHPNQIPPNQIPEKEVNPITKYYTSFRIVPLVVLVFLYCFPDLCISS
jgi:hypothetical protein